VLQQDPRAAARDRDLGLRKIGRWTWRAGLLGAVCSAVMALAFGYHAADAASGGTGTGGSSSSAAQKGGGSTPATPNSSSTPATQNSSSTATTPNDGGSIVIPSQPPQPASGPSHATSGGTSTHVP